MRLECWGLWSCCDMAPLKTTDTEEVQENVENGLNKPSKMPKGVPKRWILKIY